jgi:hypothetical protein
VLAAVLPVAVGGVSGRDVLLAVALGLGLDLSCRIALHRQHLGFRQERLRSKSWR